VKKLKTFDLKKYRIEYYQRNSDHIKQKSKERYEKNKDSINASRKGTTGIQREKTKERTKRLAGIKDKPCLDCGNKFPSCCMDFDHIRGEKLFGITVSGNRKWETVLKEIEKCEVVCANCHRIRTAQRRIKT
jgi:hypothetical protein